MVSTYLVQNGTILSVLTGSYEKADIRVRDGMIEEIGTGLSKQPEEALIDASGLIITTGWVDAHCHIGVEEDGIGTVEMILILVVLIALVLIFKSQLTSLVNEIFDKITSQSRLV